MGFALQAMRCQKNLGQGLEHGLFARLKAFQVALRIEGFASQRLRHV